MFLHYFLHLLNKSVLKKQRAGNAGKSAKIGILELLKLQDVLRPQPWLLEVMEAKLWKLINLFLNVLFFLNFASRLCLTDDLGDMLIEKVKRYPVISISN